MQVKLQSSGQIPRYATLGSAGCDLLSTIEIVIQPRSVGLINTGLHIEIPNGYCGMVCSRSGLALNSMISVLNAPGIIDSDYRGEIKVILINHNNKSFTVNPGDRIAQLLIVPVIHANFTQGDLTETQRNQGGFGHTGK
jgi:dUTP pyrophosphatase